MAPLTVQVSTPPTVECSLIYGINLVLRYGILRGVIFRKISVPLVIMLLPLEALIRILGVRQLRSGVRIRVIWVAISMTIRWFSIRRCVVIGLVLRMVLQVVLVHVIKQWRIHPISRVSIRCLFIFYRSCGQQDLLQMPNGRLIMSLFIN